MRAALGRGCNPCPAGRRGERPLYGPPTLQAIADRCLVDVQSRGGVRHGDNRAFVMHKNDATPRIMGLLSFSSPPAVSRSVIPVIVNAIKCVRKARARPNIGRENGKVVPFWADRYPSSAVVVISGSVWIPTTAAHTRPDAVKRMPGNLAGSTPMRLGANGKILSPTASARTGGAASQVATRHGGYAPAIALTVPHNAMRRRSAKQPKHDKPTEPLAGQICACGCWHERDIADVSHGRGPLAGLVSSDRACRGLGCCAHIKQPSAQIQLNVRVWRVANEVGFS